jgi:hypothetical protein
VASALVEECLQKAADSRKISLEQLKELPLHMRGDYHDDITVVVVDL